MNPKKHLLHYNTKALITLRKILMLGMYSMMYLFSQGQDTRTRPAVSQQRLGRTITTATVKQNAVENINARRINTSSATLKKEFATFNQGEYSLISLKLPGSTTESDYYVKKYGNKLILNGDIVVYDGSMSSIMSYTRDDETHTFGKDDLYRWPGGTVPVVLENSVFDRNNYNVIKSALDYFNFNTGIIFKERGNEEDYLVIKLVPDDGSGKAGSSPVGRQRNGSNVLELVKDKFTKGTVLHELMHTLGVYHEQARNDRDNYVSINWNNISSAAKYNFQIEGNATARGPYDYCSIMEYSTMAFAVDPSQPTIQCKSNGSVVACPACVGNRVGLTQLDINGLDALYGGIGISRFPSQMPFVSSKVPIAGCIGVADDLIRAKWDYYRNVLGDCRTNVIGLGISNATYVEFDYGEIFKSPHGVFAIYGDIYQLFKGGGLGTYGLPLTDETDIHDSEKGIFLSWNKAGYTRMNKFEKGVIVWGAQKKTKALTNDQFTAGPNPITKATITDQKTYPSRIDPNKAIRKSTSVSDSMILRHR